MTDDIRRQILREFPEFAAGYHWPQSAIVLATPDTPAQGGISDNHRPRFALNIELINSRGERTGQTLDAVPVEIPAGGGHERGLFALPEPGTIVTVEWLNGSPERPLIRGIIPDGLALPHLEQGAQTWQQANHRRQIIDRAGNWNRETDQTITDNAATIEQTAQTLNQTMGTINSRVHGHSRYDITGEHRTESAALHLLAETVANILAAGSVNTVAGEHITHSAGGDIRQHATGNCETTTGGDCNTTTNGEHNTTAGTSASLTAPLIHIGPDGQNLLQTISAALAQVSAALTSITALTVTCTGPGNPSSVPINAPTVVAIQTQLDNLKTQLDAASK